MSQLTLNFEPALPERFRTLRDYLAHRIHVQSRPAKSIAADMDMSPSMLSRKLSPSESDTQRFNTEDLEAYLTASGDASAVIEYLAAKFLQGDEQRKASAIARVEQLSKELERTLAVLKVAA